MAITESGGAWFNYVPGTMYGVAGGNFSGEQLLNDPSLNRSPSGNPYVANFQNLQVPPPTPSGTNFSAMGMGGNPQSIDGGATPWGTAGGLLPGNLSAYGQPQIGAGSVSPVGAAMNPQGAVSALGGPNIIPGPRAAPNPTLAPPSATGAPPSPGDRLASIVGGQGNPINQLPAWQSMVAAQQRNIQENAANLGEQFNLSGNRFGSAFGTAMTDYYNQANLQQNALLGQMTAQAGESAQNRLLNASGQLSSQDFQSMMQQYGLSSQMAQQLFGAQNQAAQGMFGAQNSALAPFLNYNLGQSGIYSNLASQYGNLYQGNLGLGSQLGGQQYGLGQSAINNQYQNWLYQQPQNNPFMQYLQELMTYYPSMVQPGYQPGFLGQALGALGAGAGAYAGAVCWIAEAVYGTNDPRTHLVRKWINGPFQKTKMGKVVVVLYRRFGQRIAHQIRKHPILKPAFKPLFDIALRKARKYHGNASGTSILWPADGRTTAWRVSAE